jgi:hypothetical protein
MTIRILCFLLGLVPAELLWSQKKEIDHDRHSHHHNEDDLNPDHLKDRGHDSKHDVSEQKNHEHDSKSDHHEDEHSDHDSHHHDDQPSENKAIQDVKDDGIEFRLSEQAILRIGIKTEDLATRLREVGSTFTVPKSYLVFSQKMVGLYFSHDRWFRLIEVEVMEKSKSTYKVRLKSSPSHYDLVTDGIPLLRVAQLEAMGKGGQGHVH